MKPSVRLICLGIGVVSVVALTIISFEVFRPAHVCGWSTKRQREVALSMDLFTMRHAIDSYVLDKQEPPKSLQDLVNMHYLKKTPIDPFTCEKDWCCQWNTWCSASIRESSRNCRCALKLGPCRQRWRGAQHMLTKGAVASRFSFRPAKAHKP